MRRFVFFLLSVLATASFADNLGARARKYAMDAGASPKEATKFSVLVGADNSETLIDWAVPGVPVPTPAQLAAVDDLVAGALPAEELIKDPGTGKYRGRSQAEKDAAAIAAIPTSTKKLFNRYIRICNEVLVVLADPRAGTNVLLTEAELYSLLDAADGKNEDKKLAKVTRQLALTLSQLNKADPEWPRKLRYDAAVGE